MHIRGVGNIERRRMLMERKFVEFGKPHCFFPVLPPPSLAALPASAAR
jgi:hypothetical protein